MEQIEKIVVLDFGGQYTHLIANRVRRLGVYAEIQHNDYLPTLEELKFIKGIILSGGPNSVYDEGSPQPDKGIFELGIPVLGLCYGHQVLSKILGGTVQCQHSQNKAGEYGIAKLNILDQETLIFKGLSKIEQIWMSHKDFVSQLPEGFQIIATTEQCESAAIQNFERKIFGFQFHPEVTHSINGLKIIENFINICECKRSWDSKNYSPLLISQIQQKVLEHQKVFVLVSGGVDSTVTFTLLNKALGKERVYGLFIDNGLLRKDEFQFVDYSIKQLGYDNFHSYDASETFLKKLENVYDPEAKRKIIGDTFIQVQREALAKLSLEPENWLLAQGTIYPDVIESQGTKHAHLIKTHHNRVEIIQKMIEQGKVVEPISQLYKDEVRELGLSLGLPENLIFRHPFPGPGLGVRCLCVAENDIQTNLKFDNTLINNIVREYGLVGEILQIKSVGVQGDQRTYKHPAVLYGSFDQISQLTWQQLEEISTQITNKVVDVNRVTLLVSHENIPQNVQLFQAFINPERLKILKDADSIATNIVEKHNLIRVIWQFPTVSIPFGNENRETIILRPVFSQEAMTAEFAKIDQQVVFEIANTIITQVPQVEMVLYDLTNKPPGTIEWE